jgi:hypothetical protein
VLITGGKDMAISLTLRVYKADPAPSRRFAVLRRAWPAFALAIGSVVYFTVAGSPPEPGISAVPGTPGVTVAEASPFESNNWGSLPRGETRVATPSKLDTDLECAEWETRESLKNLRAIAVCEVAPSVEPSTSMELAKNLLDARH